MNNIVENAVRIAVEWGEANGIHERTDNLRSTAGRWYIHMKNYFDNSENGAEELAAAAISGFYSIGTTPEEVREIHRFLFNSSIGEDDINHIDGYSANEADYLAYLDSLDKYEDIHAGEIEAALHDMEYLR